MAILQGPIIAAGEVLSTAIDLGQTKPFVIFTPDDWTPANLSFQISSDGVKFVELHGPDGGRVQLSCDANQAIALDAGLWPKEVRLKFRSGTPQHPVPQAAARAFTLLVA